MEEVCPKKFLYLKKNLTHLNPKKMFLLKNQVLKYFRMIYVHSFSYHNKY